MERHTTEADMESELETFVRHGTSEKWLEFLQYGTKEELLKVPAGEILSAMAEGRDIHIKFAVINGDLDIGKIGGQLKHQSGGLLLRGNISIQYSMIVGNVDFGRARFAQNVEFPLVTFDGNVSFWGVTFGGDVEFEGASFSGDACFIGASFDGSASFPDTSFSGDAKFEETSFGREAVFVRASFSEYANFHEAKFSKLPALDKAKFTRLWPGSFDSIGWAYRKSSLPGAANFFERAGGGHWGEESFSEASDSFRNAKVEYEKEGKYDEAGKMYVKEKESTRLHLKNGKANLPKRAWFWTWKHTSNYGESPLRFIGWVAAIVVIFAIIYMPILSRFDWWPYITFEKYPFHQWTDGIIDGVAYNIVTALYFSAVTFATLGFGDIAPVSIAGKVCAIAEVLLGYLMFGVLITLVARKMTRG